MYLVNYVILYSYDNHYFYQNHKRKKEKAAKIAQERSVSLDSLVNEALDEAIEKGKNSYIVNDKEAVSYQDEEPSEWLIKQMKQAEKDRQAGKG